MPVSEFISLADEDTKFKLLEPVFVEKGKKLF